MGRAIDMERDIDTLKLQVKKLDDTVRGMVSKLDEMDEKSSKTKHVDLVEDVGTEVEDANGDAEELGSVITGEYKDEEKETNDEGSGKSDKQSNNKRRKSSKKNV
jgi:predicted  nucleic acid-binding Zn-ribbon protein